MHKAIATENLNEVEHILNSENGPRILEIPDKFGNYPLMIAVNRNNLTYTYLKKMFKYLKIYF